jgi:hypothetical protein
MCAAAKVVGSSLRVLNKMASICSLYPSPLVTAYLFYLWRLEAMLGRKQMRSIHKDNFGVLLLASVS